MKFNEDDYVMADEKKTQKVDRWIDAYHRDKRAEEISVFECNKEKCTLVYKECKRKIGF